MIEIRAAKASDASGILEIYRPIVRETAISFETDPPSEAAMADRIERTLETYPWLVAEDPEGRLVGYAYATELRGRPAYRWSTEVSVYVREGLRRSGVGRRLYGRLFGILTELGYVNAFAGIALPNPGSVAFHERLGFEPIGVYRRVGFKLGRWHDVGWWQKALRPPDARPTSPRPFGDRADDI